MTLFTSKDNADILYQYGNFNCDDAVLIVNIWLNFLNFVNPMLVCFKGYIGDCEGRIHRQTSDAGKPRVYELNYEEEIPRQLDRKEEEEGEG